MKILPKQEANFLDKDFRNYKAILVYGNDSSLVSERTVSLCKKVIADKDSEVFSKVQLNYGDVVKDPSLLVGYLSSNSLLCKSKCIIIDEVESSINKELKSVFLDNHFNNIIILKSGELTPSSSTRKCFESETELAALPCYAIDERGVKDLVLKRLCDNHIRCEPGVIDYVVSHLRGEYLSISSEIDKMILCVGNKGVISVREVEELLSGSSEKNTYDRLIRFLVNGDIASAENEFFKLASSGVHVIAISRNIANYFVRVLKIKELVSQNIYSETEAFHSLKPPIFFKHLEDFRKALHKYSIVQIVNIIESCTNLEIECKTTNISPLLCWDKVVYKLFVHQKA